MKRLHAFCTIDTVSPVRTSIHTAKNINRRNGREEIALVRVDLLHRKVVSSQSIASLQRYIRSIITLFKCGANVNGSTRSSCARIEEEAFIQLERSDCHSIRLDCIGIYGTKHIYKRETVIHDRAKTSGAKLVDGEVPCLVVIELALAFHY
jgi:hypothetical protein